MILITGSTGFVGRSVTNALTLNNIPWRPHKERINNPLALRQQLSDVTCVIHLAGAEWRGRNRLLNHVDIDGTKRLIEECQRANVSRLIYLSRLNADPDSLHPLLRTKGEVERLIRRSGLTYTILQSATLYGRNDRFFELIVSLAIWSWPFVWLPGDGTTPIQPLWLEDFTRCLLIILQQEARFRNKTIKIAGEERLRYSDLVRQLLYTVNRSRFPLKLPMILLRPLNTFLFRWWLWPAITRYAVDRFFVPEITEFDTIVRHFGFHPNRLNNTIAYLNRPGLRWRLFHR